MKFNEKWNKLRHIDLARMICNHLVGDSHTKVHRFSAGVIIMAVGVTVTKVVLMVESGFIHAFGDLIGYAIHGIGAIPFVEHLIQKHSK